MVKLVGPLMSEAASGQVAKVQVHMRRRGQNIARRYTRQGVRRSPAQQRNRSQFAVANIVVGNAIRFNLALSNPARTIRATFTPLLRPGQTLQSFLVQFVLGGMWGGYDACRATYDGLTQTAFNDWDRNTNEGAGVWNRFDAPDGTSIDNVFQSMLLQRPWRRSPYSPIGWEDSPVVSPRTWRSDVPIPPDDL